MRSSSRRKLLALPWPFALAIALLSTAACSKQKSAAAKAECEQFVDVVGSAPGAMRGALGGGPSVYAERMDRIRAQIAGVALTDPKLVAFQTRYLEIIDRLTEAARRPGMTVPELQRWFDQATPGEEGLRTKIAMYCSKP